MTFAAILAGVSEQAAVAGMTISVRTRRDVVIVDPERLKSARRAAGLQKRGHGRGLSGTNRLSGRPG
jgi:hypothetical protein